MNIGLILSGGVGERLGAGIPKQYIMVNGKVILSYCLEVFFSHEDIDAVQIVASSQWHQLIREQMTRMSRHLQNKFKGFSSPGSNRQLSILNGLKDIRKYAVDMDRVIIHDGARPLITQEQISSCLKASMGHGGAIPVLPMKDTVYLGDGNRITSLLDRSHVYAGQSPETFVLGEYYKANIRLLPDEIYGIIGSTEPAVLAGMDIAMTVGDEMNFKITTKDDLERFLQIQA